MCDIMDASGYVEAVLSQQTTTVNTSNEVCKPSASKRPKTDSFEEKHTETNSKSGQVSNDEICKASVCIEEFPV